ncbi:MAG: hypothetical protein IPK63_20010 [Candidatus Competibacteraceae bacterium]|nr:hypothetical protein [Candidatus Competibacteraceae bacterium]
MRTVIIITVGIFVASLLLALLRKRPGAPNTAIVAFTLTWLAFCGWNFSVGVSHGYSFAEEIPFFLANFAVPVIFMWLVRHRFGGPTT